ncbi:hypothetical protein MTR62_10890 [Novosphingobium sp. 1949]|uniref:Uncharacterized protein n=1 Tax=Novosphingobium organovorum TaxID=2930092 RepID=A0ABT0BEH9_9SPHN|nr:hypothetical protein [Novosphingobium organovorum]MCJ2183194.1 hypothetical protein [Novosphingobium organovorum]
MKKGLRGLAFKIGLGAAAGACALAGAAPQAMARDHYRDGGDTAAIAIGAGILGLAVGASLADRGDRYYYDRSRYSARRYVTLRDRPGYYYYYEGYPDRYYRDRYYTRYYAPYYRDHYREWGRGYRADRHYDRRDRHHDRGYDRHHDERRRHDRDWHDDRRYRDHR